MEYRKSYKLIKRSKEKDNFSRNFFKKNNSNFPVNVAKFLRTYFL